MVAIRLSAGALIAVVLAFSMAWADRPREESPSTVAYSIRPAKFVGSLSCASASCHASGELKSAGGEYTTWSDGDPHAKAYEVLSNERSRRMVTLLHGKKVGTPAPAYENKLCLSCHAPEAVGSDHLTPVGVGCESCHGPAEHYLTTHYRSDFKSLSRREKAEQFGLAPTKDLAFRTAQCASCHVGDSTRDVNHDLVAAGHPRLAFEYGGYHHNPKYARHWNESAYGPDFDARSWEIGQLASAAAAAELLAVRARDTDRPWPELAEYSCFACHKDLDGAAWKPHVAPLRAAGNLPWGNWYFATVGLLSPEVQAEVDALAMAVEKPRPRSEVATAADKVAQRLKRLASEHQARADADSKTRPYTGKQLETQFDRVVRHALTADGTKFAIADWDGATQHYLSAAALYHSWAAVDPAGRDARPRPALEAIRSGLQFPYGVDSPRGARPADLLNQFRRLRPVEARP